MISKKSKIVELVKNGLPLNHIPVIDFHCHLGTSSEYYYIPHNSPDEVVSYMDRFGIDHIITFAITVTTDPAPGNNLQYIAAQKYPQRMSALTLLHAKFPQDWKVILREGYKQGSRGIGELLSVYQGVDESRIDWSEAFEYAGDKNWVVLNHDWSTPERLEYWAKKFPEIIFIIGHASTAYSKVVQNYENVYQCTCASFAFAVSTRDMVNSMPVEKIIYGSDALDLDFGTGIGPIVFADITEEEKELILGRNALSIIDKLGWNINIGKEYS